MINNVVLMGRLTAAPDLRQTASGINVTSFCLAIDRRFQQPGVEKKTDFINCIAWRQTADFICTYFGKGDLIAVTGEIQSRKYKDTAGNNRTAVEVVVSEASFCGGKNNGGNTTDQTTADAGFTPCNVDDDLPF